MLKDFLIRWNKEKNERQKLQGVYLVFGSVFVIIAGVITFINVTAGYTLVWAGLILLGAFVLNGLVWHFMDSAVLRNLKQTTRKK